MISSLFVPLLSLLRNVSVVRGVSLLRDASLLRDVSLLREASLLRDASLAQDVIASLLHPESSSLAVRGDQSLCAANVPDCSFSWAPLYSISFCQLAQLHGESDGATTTDAQGCNASLASGAL
jgi:hypothetical protein